MGTSTTTGVGGASGMAGCGMAGCGGMADATPPKAEILDPKAAATAATTDPKASAATQAGGPTGATTSTANAIAGANGSATANNGGAAQALGGAATIPGLEGILDALQAMIQQLMTLMQQLVGGGGAVQQMLTGAPTDTAGADGGAATDGGGAYSFAPLNPTITQVDQNGDATQSTTATATNADTGGAYGAGVDQNGNGIPDQIEQLDPTPAKGAGNVDTNGDGTVDGGDTPTTTPLADTNGGAGVDANGDGKVDDADTPTTTPAIDTQIGKQLDQAHLDLTAAETSQKTAAADLKTANAAESTAKKLVTSDQSAVDAAQSKLDKAQTKLDAATTDADKKALSATVASDKEAVSTARSKLLKDSAAATKAGSAQDAAQSKADKATGAVDALRKLIKELNDQREAEQKKQAAADKKAADDKAKADKAKKAADDKVKADKAAKAAKPGETGSAKADTYVVQRGDTLSAIARALSTKAGYPISWQALYAANKSVIGGNPDQIDVGQKLAVPAKGADTTTTTTTTATDANSTTSHGASGAGAITYRTDHGRKDGNNDGLLDNYTQRVTLRDGKPIAYADIEYDYTGKPAKPSDNGSTHYVSGKLTGLQLEQVQMRVSYDWSNDQGTWIKSEVATGKSYTIQV